MNNTKTIKEAKAYLRENFSKGVNCPCCGKYVRLWKYQIHSTMARLLIALYHKDANGIKYSHVNDLWQHIGNKSMGGDFSKLTLWELIEKQPKNDDKTKRSSGYWKITPLGKSFVENITNVHKIIYVFDGKIDNVEGDVYIKESLGKKFNYAKLMGYD